MKMMRKSPALASRKYPTIFMLLDLKPRAYAWPIIVYSKQVMSQCNMYDVYLFNMLFTKFRLTQILEILMVNKLL